jgi:[ribosomal protein S5]-alanine N-acetyltransferase
MLVHVVPAADAGSAGRPGTAATAAVLEPLADALTGLGCSARRALLREWTPDDGAWYVGQLDDPEIRRFTSERPDTTAADFRAALEVLNKQDDLAGFAVLDASTGELAGNLAARLTDGAAICSYWIARNYRGRGLATDALRQLSRWVAANWPGSELALQIDAENLASIRVAEKAGFGYQRWRDESDYETGRTRRWYARAR